MPTMKKAANTPASVNDLLSSIDTFRDQIGALRADRTQIEAAPRPLADVLDDLDDHLDHLATEAIDGLSLHHLRDRRGTFGLKLSQSGHAEIAVANLLGLVVATNRAAVRDLIANQLSDLEQSRPGLSDEDRLARLAELDGEILRTEMAEEAALRALERLGVQIGRRADLSPVVALAADQALPVQ
ncbi:hypothetical protein [Rhodobacter viridis]|nr:hypothetical protein [Rhodobacter viridis]